jgi:hypothetical protein
VDGAQGSDLGQRAPQISKSGEKTMRTTILKAIGAALIVSSTVQMAAAAEHHTRRDRATAAQQEQFRNSNDYYYAAPDFRARDSFAMWPRAWPEQDEAAMSSGIAGH